MTIQMIDLVQMHQLFVRINPKWTFLEIVDWTNFCEDYIDSPIEKISPILLFEYDNRFYSFCDKYFIRTLYELMCQRYPTGHNKGFSPIIPVEFIDEDFVIDNYGIDFEDLMMQSVPLIEL